MTPRKKIFGDFFGKKGGKSQNFEKSFDTPKDAILVPFVPSFSLVTLRGTERSLRTEKI